MPVKAAKASSDDHSLIVRTNVFVYRHSYVAKMPKGHMMDECDVYFCTTMGRYG
ncbi:hypothetical protein QGN29_10415 [Temperatibacter marinus]|uniref:Uncharacterized protein n=1 Tax=Temperatibacter marinus TaxID=1456591 RepID=A0AA52EH44_9PROT|nr:hypothetical protein [Temperatibacter marinus]WND01961.1 hypothetical protein QGN29_10415 [Temperatibacter marinus]